MTLFCGSCIVATAASGTSSAPLQEAAGFLIVPFEKGIAGVSDIFGNVKNNLRDKQDVLQENEELKSQINSLTEQNNILIQEVKNKNGIDFSMPYMLGYSGLDDSLLRKYIADSADLWAGQTKELPISTIGSTIGTHAGPGAICVSFFHK